MFAALTGFLYIAAGNSLIIHYSFFTIHYSFSEALCLPCRRKICLAPHVFSVAAHSVRPITANKSGTACPFRPHTGTPQPLQPTTNYQKPHSGGREGVGGLGKESAEGKPQGGKGEGGPASLLCRAPPPCPLKAVPLHSASLNE